MNITEFRSQLTSPTVECFRRAGFKVSVMHRRPVIDQGMTKYIPRLPRRVAEEILKSCETPFSVIREYGFQDCIWPRGGETQVTVEKDGLGSFTAAARCSVQDGYNRRLGIQMCLGRISQEIYHTLLDATQQKSTPQG